MNIEPIAYIETDFPEKFGIPRQSGIVSNLKGRIRFEPQYRNKEAVKGLEEFSYIWVLWGFEDHRKIHWSATVKPPRLGGNVRKGVFATRSPFRPNPIGLSSLKLEKIVYGEEGPELFVSGVDMKNGTKIYDIKPYLEYVDSHENAGEGFASGGIDHRLEVIFPEELLEKFLPEKRKTLVEVLAQDPRPSYHDDPERRYGMAFDQYDVRFKVRENKLTVYEVVSYDRSRRET